MKQEKISEDNKEKINDNEQNNLSNNESNNNENIIKEENIKINENNKYYIPICREKHCKGHLKIIIDELKFTIDGVCSKNKNHIFNDLFFDTFEKFYLKENKTKNCFSCSINLDNKNAFKCKKCENIFCSNCFISDKHIQEDIKNLSLLTNRCSIDQNELTNYCVDCGEKLCIFCFKKYEEKNPHKNHTIINIANNAPSIEKMKKLKEKILKKSEAFNSLIKSLNEWQKELNKKMERIKQNLKKEINLIKKLYMNFNIDYIDYTYYSNFNEIFYNLEDYNNEFFKEFMKSYNFNEKTKCILNYLTYNPNNPKVVNNNYQLKEFYSGNNELVLEKFIKRFCFYYSNYHKYISLVEFKDTSFYNPEERRINFKDKILCFNFSPSKEKIYVILANKKGIIFLDYNFEENTLQLTDDKIEIDEPGNFKKCIYLKDNWLLVIDDNNVYLFFKNDLNLIKFTNTNKITFEDKIYDICKIDNKFALISQKSKLIFIKIENLSKEKEINNIDCLEKPNNLILIKDCVLVNCEKGIAIILLKTKEMVQYKFDDEILGDKKIVKLNNNYIYILNTLGNLLKYNFHEYNLILNEKSKIEKPDDTNLSEKEFFINQNLLPLNNGLFIWSKKIYFI